MGQYEARYESLATHPVPEWFRDAKLGIFVHWTAATIPAFAPLTDDPFTLGEQRGWEYSLSHSPYVEWYQNSASIEGSPAARHHAEVWGGVGYDEFVRRFVESVEAWDPEVWGELFASAGARYVVFVTKHHDGVTLWPSRTPNPHRSGWAVRRDCVSELAAAVRARNLRYGVYYSGGLDWTFGGLPIDSFEAMLRAIPHSPEYCAYADAQWRELIELVRPDVLWNDIAYSKGAAPEQLFADFYNGNPDGVVNDRFDIVRHPQRHVPRRFRDARVPQPQRRARPHVRGVSGHRAQLRLQRLGDRGRPTSHRTSWCGCSSTSSRAAATCSSTSAPRRPARSPPPKPLGSTALGWWLRTNGAAIYGTRPAATNTGSADGRELRYTERDGVTYAIVLGPAATNEVALDRRPAPGSVIRRLGERAELPWAPTDAGCRITLPIPPPPGPALSFSITPAG